MNSATSQSLLGFMSHWQSFESSLMNFMVETVVKLSTFTDAGFFILIETPEGKFLREGQLVVKPGDTEFGLFALLYLVHSFVACRSSVRRS